MLIQIHVVEFWKLKVCRILNFPAKFPFHGNFPNLNFSVKLNSRIFFILAGLVSIKLRLKDQKPMMERLDPVMKKLVADLKDCAPDEKNDIEAKIKARVEILSPIYHQVAVQYADLHDTPARMMAKG